MYKITQLADKIRELTHEITSGLLVSASECMQEQKGKVYRDIATTVHRLGVTDMLPLLQSLTALLKHHAAKGDMRMTEEEVVAELKKMPCNLIILEYKIETVTNYLKLEGDISSISAELIKLTHHVEPAAILLSEITETQDMLYAHRYMRSGSKPSLNPGSVEIEYADMELMYSAMNSILSSCKGLSEAIQELSRTTNDVKTQEELLRMHGQLNVVCDSTFNHKTRIDKLIIEGPLVFETSDGSVSKSIKKAATEGLISQMASIINVLESVTSVTLSTNTHSAENHGTSSMVSIMEAVRMMIHAIRHNEERHKIQLRDSLAKLEKIFSRDSETITKARQTF